MVAGFEFGVFEVLELVARVKDGRGLVRREHHPIGADVERALFGELGGIASQGDGGGGRAGIAVRPSDLDGIGRGVRGALEGVFDDGVDGPVILVRCRAAGDDGGGRGETEGAEPTAEHVAAHVTERAGAEIAAAAPVAGVIVAVDITALAADAEPLVPIEFGGDGIALRGAQTQVTPFFVGEGMHFRHFADLSHLNEGHREPLGETRGNLDAHLGHHALGTRPEHQLTAFPQVLREGFLAINVLAEADGGEPHAAVHVVGSGHVHGVDLVALLGQHFPPVLIDPDVRPAFLDAFEIAGIHVAHGGEFPLGMRGHGIEVAPAHARRAKGGVAELAIGRCRPQVGGDKRSRKERGGGLADEMAARLHVGMTEVRVGRTAPNPCVAAGRPAWRWRFCRW